jgi:hypothetical protein
MPDENPDTTNSWWAQNREKYLPENPDTTEKENPMPDYKPGDVVTLEHPDGGDRVSTLTRESIQAAKDRADAATEGPWELRTWRGGDFQSVTLGDSSTVWDGTAQTAEGDYIDSPDIDFIVAARTDVPAMAEALLAVLDLHVSDGDDYQPECRGCRAECMYCEGDHHWPCATVRAITGREA